MAKFKTYPGSHKGLHWQWPFESKEWGPDGDVTIVASQTTANNKKVIVFNDAAFMEPATLHSWAIIPTTLKDKIQRVNAPISGEIASADRNGRLATVTIVTCLADGTRIYNTFSGLFDAPVKLVAGYAVAQGEWIGYSTSNYLGLGDDAPFWYCQAALPGQATSYVYANTFAETYCNGIDWKDEFTHIPEMTLSAQPSGTASAIAPQKTSGMLWLGAAVAAYLLLGKGK